MELLVQNHLGPGMIVQNQQFDFEEGKAAIKAGKKAKWSSFKAGKKAKWSPYLILLLIILGSGLYWVFLW